MSSGFVGVVFGVGSGSVPPVVSPAGLLLYGVGTVFILTLVQKGVAKQQQIQQPAVWPGDYSGDGECAGEPGSGEVAGVGGWHRGVVAAAGIEWETRRARLDEEWVTGLVVTGYPDVPMDGYLSGLFEVTDVTFDVTARVVPRDQQRARATLQRTADALQADANLEQSVRRAYLKERAANARETYTAVENGQRVFDQELVVTVRADSQDELQRAVTEIRGALREHPAGLEPKTAVCRQREALQAAAPIGASPLDHDAVALGGAVGALFASPHSAGVLDDGGIEVGRHIETQSPLVVDPFGREDGYAKFTVGDPGSGKSFSAKQQFLRTIQQDPDRLGVILEPLSNWAGVAHALDAKRVTVGGTLGLNPLEIKPTPPGVLADRGTDASPLKERRDRVVSFFTNYFHHRNVELGDRRTTLEVAIDTAYDNRGITADVSTHSRASPTVCDVLDVLAGIVDAPEEFVVRDAAETGKLESDAVWLLDQLRPFAGEGQFANLGRESEFDIRDEQVVYLDLQQYGGSLGGHTSLLMELLISLVYERAKETDKEVVFVIDEARYLMQDAATLSYLETIFRHHRHHDLSIQLITQTVDEFFQHDIAKMILDQCAIKQFHKLDGMNTSIAESFGLNDAQKRFIQEAVPGSEETGYAQALLGVDGEWRGMEVHALPYEQAVIENSPPAGESEEDGS